MSASKYKVGDRVKIKSLDWYNENKDSNGNVVFSSKVTHFSWRENVRTVFTKDMSKFCGKVVTIETVWTVNYSIVEGTNIDYFTDEMIEGLVEEETYDFLKTDKPNRPSLNDFMDMLDNEIKLPQGYQFKDENGNIINATKIVLEKKKKEYPKTYEECAKELGYNQVMPKDHILGYKGTLLSTFQQLLICRDAYWKIAGEEMGLGKPWEPDCTSGYFIPAIIYRSGSIQKVEVQYRNAILSFPTEEIRDAFYENFKKEIEICKELL